VTSHSLLPIQSARFDGHRLDPDLTALAKKINLVPDNTDAE
jgi:hypothetical protein